MQQLAKILVVSLVLQILLPAVTVATDSESQLQDTQVVISEIVTGTQETASAEYVELYNLTEEVVDLGGWELDYQSAGGSTWRDKIEEETENQTGLIGQIAPKGFFTVATTELQQAYPDKRFGATLSSGLAESGGHLRLRQVEPDSEQEPLVQDTVSWGEAEQGEELSPAPAPENDLNQSLKRQFNNEGRIMVTGDLGSDFVISCQPTPDTTRLPDEDDSVPESETQPQRSPRKKMKPASRRKRATTKTKTQNVKKLRVKTQTQTRTIKSSRKKQMLARRTINKTNLIQRRKI